MPASLSQSYSVTSAAAPGILSWLKASLGHPEAELHTKLRGNILHVLCETPVPLDQSTVLLKLVRSLLDDREQGLLQQTYPQVYQVYLYSRLTGQPDPDWTAPLYLNRLERHLAQLVLESQDEADLKAAQSLLADYAQDHPNLLNQGEDGSGAMVLSNLSLARKGDPEAIAWYLSETLSALDVGVWVSIKAIPGTAHLHRTAIAIDDFPAAVTARSMAPSIDLGDAGGGEAGGAETAIPRLWILCEATYSPDPSLIARPTAERLRLLHLTQFKDAVLLLQVRGESKPDWSLRIDLTPPEEMLREWGRWGDTAALDRLLTAALDNHHVAVEARLTNATLHLTCRPQGGGHQVYSPDPLKAKTEIVETLTTRLEDLAPQGIHRAVIYGQPQPQADPDWVHYLDLPAAQHSALADPPEYLAQEGDLPALAFLLTRQLNPNLDDRLATGGLRVQLLLRDKLLHVMVDSPLPPQRRWVAPLLHTYLLNLSPVGIEGIRVYGRRSGQLQPAWSYGRDFLVRSRLVPESTPEFTASDAYVNELLVRPDGPITHTEIDPEEEQAALALWWQEVVNQWRSGLARSHLFVGQHTPSVLDATTESMPAEGLKIALVWAAVGLLVALQVDWLLGQVLSPSTNSVKAEPMVTASPPAPTTDDNDPNGFEQALAELDWPTGDRDLGGEGFVSGTETAIAPSGTALTTSPNQPIINIADLVATSPFSTFNSDQLNEKVALYRQRLATSGPADVMIVGSSRALRGVDPVALQKKLAAMGYDTISIFNFGINGATAQVVDLVIREVLEPNQLPKLIIWADGARAFNSGREDVTYNAIVASPGYRELIAQRTEGGTATPDRLPEVGGTAAAGDPASLPNSYAAMDQWMSDQLASLSAVYGDRDRLKDWLQNRIAAAPLPGGGFLTEERLDAPMPEGSAIDFDGFLPLSVRFNPATYYQTYARVLGRYDGDYDSFHLDGSQTEAFASLLSFTQANNIPIVFINTPLTDEYLDDYRQEAEAEFLRYMLTLSTTESGFIFRDLGQVWPQRYDYFSDPSHLNRYGAYQVSHRLAQDPLIAWPRVSAPPSP
jgi:hypothetical protein